MEYYLDIIIIDSDIVGTQNKLLNIIHGFICKSREIDSDFQLAVSFPEWEKKHIGHVLRVFSSYENLSSFSQQPPIKLFIIQRTILLNKIKKIPCCDSYICYKRYRGMVDEIHDLIYFKTSSKSNNNKFSLFIVKKNASLSGYSFSTYGLSNNDAGVPYF